MSGMVMQAAHKCCGKLVELQACVAQQEAPVGHRGFVITDLASQMGED